MDTFHEGLQTCTGDLYRVSHAIYRISRYSVDVDALIVHSHAREDE
jgi:hypothetical protein